MRFFTHAPPETLRNKNYRHQNLCRHTVPSRPRAVQTCIICVASATLKSTPVDLGPTCSRRDSAPSRRALQSREWSETKRVQRNMCTSEYAEETTRGRQGGPGQTWTAAHHWSRHARAQQGNGRVLLRDVECQHVP